MPIDTDGSVAGESPAVLCFRARGDNAGWRVVLPAAAAAPVDVPALLRDSPQFLNSHNPAAPRVVALAPVRRADGTGPLLCLAVDENGGVIVAGLGRDDSRDAWTELAREVLSLSGRVWRMPLEAFGQPFAEAAGRPLWETAAAALPAPKAGERFRAGVEASLARGHFPVRLLARVADEECRQAVGYFAGMSLDAVGLVPESYECSGVEVVVAQPVLVHVEVNPAHIERPRPAATPIPQPASKPAQPRPAQPAAPAGTFQSSRPPTLSTAPRHATFGGGGSGDETSEGKVERNWPKLGGLGESTDKEGKAERNWPKLGDSGAPEPKPATPERKPALPSQEQSAPNSPLSTRAPVDAPPAPTGRGPAPGTSPGTMSNKRPPKSGWGGLGKNK